MNGLISIHPGQIQTNLKKKNSSDCLVQSISHKLVPLPSNKNQIYLYVYASLRLFLVFFYFLTNVESRSSHQN